MGQLTEFGKVFIYLIVGSLLVTATMSLVRFLSPKKPTSLKLSSYECGEKPIGNSWAQFNTRFYVVALVFLLFDVEMVFIYPWSTVFAQKSILHVNPFWGWLCIIEMFVFVGILLLGLVYVWQRKDLDWIKATPVAPTANTVIPFSVYDALNKKDYKTRRLEKDVETLVATTAVPAARPAFKPAFRKKTSATGDATE